MRNELDRNPQRNGKFGFNSFRQRADLVLMHPPSIYRFRQKPTFCGPISDVVPSSAAFEIYPIGFLTLSSYLHRHGISVRIINMAMKMIRDSSFDPESLIATLEPAAFGIDLHWLPHADGSLSLAEAVKRAHPDIPVILGGLTATYFHDEIMREHPYVDFILCGDSAEEPLRLLMEAVKAGREVDSIPNLVWRRGIEIRKNPRSYRPDNLDYLTYDYPHLVRMAVKYCDPSGYMPFQHWLRNPVTAVLSCRGCLQSCASCGGSLAGFRNACIREKPAFRSPELLAADIHEISRFTGAPIMIIGDLLQGGEEYAFRFLSEIRRYQIDNELAVEFFNPPAEEFVRELSASIKHFNVEMSPESHDPAVRKLFGKSYTNAEFERSVRQFIDCGARRIDLFFMIGLPGQDYDSAISSADYCGELLERYGKKGNLLPMIAPLAPFIDPGSRIFENAGKFGYRLFHRTLQEHRQAMLMPSWKYTLNYETKWMTRDDIVRATYDSALQLAQIKRRYGVISQAKAQHIQQAILSAKALINKIDSAGKIDEGLGAEVFALNRLDSICHKRELEWPVKGGRLKLLRLAKMLAGFTP